MAVTLADNALTTIVNAKAYFGGDACGSSDLAKLISQASTLIESQADREFGVEAVTAEKVRGYGGLRLMVTRTPVRSITEIRFRDCVVDLTEVQLEDEGKTGSIIRPGGWTWTGHRANDVSQGRLPGTEMPYYEVDYTGGYVLPKDDGGAFGATDLPADLELACLELMRHIQAVNSRDPTVSSEKILSWSASYTTGLENNTVATIIRKYRRCSF